MSRYKIYYHATPYENLGSIVCNGIKANNIEGLVYLCEKEEDAIKFLAIRGIRNFCTFKVIIKKPKFLIETFDHNYMFFKCRCFGYQGDIPADWIEPSKKWEL